MSSAAFQFQARNAVGFYRTRRLPLANFIVDKPLRGVYAPGAISLSEACDSHRVSPTPPISLKPLYVDDAASPAVCDATQESVSAFSSRGLPGILRKLSFYPQPPGRVKGQPRAASGTVLAGGVRGLSRRDSKLSHECGRRAAETVRGCWAFQVKLIA